MNEYPLAALTAAEAILKQSDGIWWCNSHQREATWIGPRGRECDPKLGGIMLPCRVIFAPVRIENLPNSPTNAKSESP
jgi:hypothetical protein